MNYPWMVPRAVFNCHQLASDSGESLVGGLPLLERGIQILLTTFSATGPRVAQPLSLLTSRLQCRFGV